MTGRIFTAAILFLAISAYAAALSAAAGGRERTEGLTVSDVIYMEAAGDFDVSPDGHWAVWIKRTQNKKHNGSQSNVFLTNLSDTATIQVTRGYVTDSAPRFSPTGSHVAFIRSKEEEKPQVYLYDMKGGEPYTVTAAEAGVRRFAWRTPDDILFTAPEDSTLRERRLKNNKDDAIVAADQEHYKPVRLFGIDRSSKKVRRLSVNGGVITEFAVSRDGRWVVTNENQDVDYDYDYRVPPKQFLLDIETGVRREILSEPHVDPFAFTWDHEGAGFYCFRKIASDATDTYVHIQYLCYYDVSADKLEKVRSGWQKGFGRAYGVIPGGVVATLADGVRDRIAHIKRAGKRYRETHLNTSSGEPIVLLAVGKKGRRMIYLSSDASSIPRIMIADIDGGTLKHEKMLYRLNGALDKKSLAETEIISWTGALGDEVEGVLYYPIGYETGRRYPLIVSLHGGPSGVDRDFFTENWSNYPHLLAAKGSCVLKVNYHGSGNYGLGWVESIKGHYYDYEVPDILGGVEHLVSQSLVDSTRIGIMGWSNGSILAIECCLRSDRFKALCAGAGDVNWISDYGNCAFGAAFDNAYLGGAPWDDPALYIDKSPLFRMQRLATPTLILFGTEDTNVPTEQGWEHFRAMQQAGEAPARFILFPGAKHGLNKPSHQQRKMEEELAWFDTYLFGTHEEKNEALDDDSPLALLIAKSKVKRAGELLGVSEHGILVPETVPFKGFAIGRFEVTRAQYGAFDPDYAYPAGTENHPANGVSYEDARRYCAWLSAKTGRSFRLPLEEEMKTVLAQAGSNAAHENTLDYWAGYTVTPDERELLDAIIEELGPRCGLIMEAGSFKAACRQGIYDLFGNVSEWTEGAAARGVALGLSAVASRDERGAPQEPQLRYTGFRVIEDEK